MAKAVFMAKVNPAYDDLPESRYHFPRTYLSTAETAIGDWILYYEPRRDHGRQVYFATARLLRIEPDPARPDHFYGYVDDYLEFLRPVPFRENGTYYESALRKADGSVNKGLFGRAVHQIPENEYALIVRLGMGQGQVLGETSADEVPAMDPNRPVVEQLSWRPLRSRAFAVMVRAAYDSTCALTGLRIIAEPNRCEMEAAHIRPVEEQGPDSPRNGIALCRTVHWMFDRGIVSLEDDGRILLADRLVPEPFRGIFNPDGYARLPRQAHLRPHPQFLKYHRDRFQA